MIGMNYSAVRTDAEPSTTPIGIVIFLLRRSGWFCYLNLNRIGISKREGVLRRILKRRWDRNRMELNKEGNLMSILTY